jgi:hypothetical protein
MQPHGQGKHAPERPRTPLGKTTGHLLLADIHPSGTGMLDTPGTALPIHSCASDRSDPSAWSLYPLLCIDINLFPSGKGPFPPWWRQSSGLLVRRTPVRLRATPRFPCQDEKCLLSESETASVPSGVSGWNINLINAERSPLSRTSRQALIPSCVEEGDDPCRRKPSPYGVFSPDLQLARPCNAFGGLQLIPGMAILPQ